MEQAIIAEQAYEFFEAGLSLAWCLVLVTIVFYALIDAIHLFILCKWSKHNCIKCPYLNTCTHRRAYHTRNCVFSFLKWRATKPEDVDPSKLCDFARTTLEDK